MRGGYQALAQVPEIQGILESLDPSAGPLLALTNGFDFFLGAATGPGEAAQVLL